MTHIGIKKLYEELRNVPGKKYVEVPESERTPKIILDRAGDAGNIQFFGRSLPDDARSFFQPILIWIEEYLANPYENTVVRFDLEYFNTSSSKMLLQIINKLQLLEESGKQLTIEWCYMEDDEDILESGETFQDLTNVAFNFICYQ